MRAEEMEKELILARGRVRLLERAIVLDVSWWMGMSLRPLESFPMGKLCWAFRPVTESQHFFVIGDELRSLEEFADYLSKELFKAGAVRVFEADLSLVGRQVRLVREIDTSICLTEGRVIRDERIWTIHSPDLYEPDLYRLVDSKGEITSAYKSEILANLWQPTDEEIDSFFQG